MKAPINDAEEKQMDTALSAAALVVSLFSAGFTLYTFIWTKVRDRKRRHWKHTIGCKSRCWII